MSLEANIRIELGRRVDAGFSLVENFDSSDVFSMRQVHGADGDWVDSEFRDGSREGDWIATQSQGLCVGVRVADCTAILCSGMKNEKPVVAAIHAGWRGTAHGILERLGEELRIWKDLRIWFSPSISQRRFEVGEEVLQALGESSKAFATAGKPGKFFLDLKGFQVQVMSRSLKDSAKIMVSPLCTWDQPELFSYRRLGPNSGKRHMAWIKII